MAERNFIIPAILKCFLSLKLQNFDVKSNSENRFTFIQKKNRKKLNDDIMKGESFLST